MPKAVVFGPPAPTNLTGAGTDTAGRLTTKISTDYVNPICDDPSLLAPVLASICPVVASEAPSPVGHTGRSGTIPTLGFALLAVALPGAALVGVGVAARVVARRRRTHSYASA